uniref:Uncharacterized protein n=1 Tax=viral metagenome TaxID=1070528 RepID=A0A6H1ZXI8_9ZZZZ
MTDTGAVIRAIKMGFEDSVICDTLHITKATLDLIKIDYGNLINNFDKGRSYEDTASLLLKDPAEVWYAYHVFESDNKTLEQEILDDNKGIPRNKLQHPVKCARPPKQKKPGICIRIYNDHLEIELGTLNLNIDIKQPEESP